MLNRDYKKQDILHDIEKFSNEKINIILAAAANRKRLIIYGTNIYASKLYHQLKGYDVDVDYFVDDELETDIFEEHAAKSVYDLTYEDLSGIFVAIVKPDKNMPKGIFPLFHPMGLKYKKNYYDVMVKDRLNYSQFAIDANLAYNKIGSVSGFKITGNSNVGEKKIVALGGSTTDPDFSDITSWPEILYDVSLSKYGGDMVIYNGGVGGYTSSQELIKLIRDVVQLNPDIVISYSGVNDLYQFPIPEFKNRYKHPFISEEMERLFRWVNQHYSKGFFTKGPVNPVIFGVENSKSAAQNWVENMRIMHAVTSEFGIKFLGIIQPMILISNYQISEELNSYLTEHFNSDRLIDVGRRHNIFHQAKNFYREVLELTIDLPYILDFTKIFDNEKDVYCDFCHLYEKGNRIIAEHIYDTLINMEYI